MQIVISTWKLLCVAGAYVAFAVVAPFASLWLAALLCAPSYLGSAILVKCGVLRWADAFWENGIPHFVHVIISAFVLLMIMSFCLRLRLGSALTAAICIAVLIVSYALLRCLL